MTGLWCGWLLVGKLSGVGLGCASGNNEYSACLESALRMEKV